MLVNIKLIVILAKLIVMLVLNYYQTWDNLHVLRVRDYGVGFIGCYSGILT